jgi:hypothetical protein
MCLRSDAFSALLQCSQPLPECLQSILLRVQVGILQVRVSCSLREQTVYVTFLYPIYK